MEIDDRSGHTGEESADNSPGEPSDTAADDAAALDAATDETVALDGTEEVAESESAPDDGGRPARNKIGVDANQPIDPKTGRILSQVADPEVIASTGAGWVRLNFILGPWDSPDDGTLHDGRTWAETYSQIISGFRQKGLMVYGLIGVEAMPWGPGDRFRTPPPQGTVADLWLDQYVDHFAAIVEMFYQGLQAVESFNEPDDWHGQDHNWVHPGWFAIILQRIYTTVRSQPALQQVNLVSGPLQGLDFNRNAAVSYLQQTYRAGKARFGWGQEDIPYPFDGVGYHLYIKGAFNPDREQHERAVRTACRRYLADMHQVIRQEEGGDRPLYVSEMGWNSRVERQEFQRREQFQAESLRAGLEVVCSDPLVELGCWFCTRDFKTEKNDMYFGLYRAGELDPEKQKPAFHTFKALCEGELQEEEPKPQYTNQEVINAFYRAAVDLGLARRWSLVSRAGLDLGQLAANRHAIYQGPPIEELPNLTEAEKALIQAHLEAEVAHAAAEPAGVASVEFPVTRGLPFDDSSDFDINFDLSLALLGQVLQQLERNNELLARPMESSTRLGSTGYGIGSILLAVGLVSLLAALAVSLVFAVLLFVLLP